MWPISQVKRKSAVEACRGRESALLGNGDCEFLDTAVEGGVARGRTLDPTERPTRTLFSQVAMENRPRRPDGSQRPPPLSHGQPLPSPASQLLPKKARNRIKPIPSGKRSAPPSCPMEKPRGLHAFNHRYPGKKPAQNTPRKIRVSRSFFPLDAGISRCRRGPGEFVKAAPSSHHPTAAQEPSREARCRFQTPPQLLGVGRRRRIDGRDRRRQAKNGIPPRGTGSTRRKDGSRRRRKHSGRRNNRRPPGPRRRRRT